MDQGSPDKDIITKLLLSNRWIHTIYSGYGKIKQRIFLEILEQVQKDCWAHYNGNKIQVNSDILLKLDMSRVNKYHIRGYNNYHQVRKAVTGMIEHDVQIFVDPDYRKLNEDVEERKKQYLPAALIKGVRPTKDKKILELLIDRKVYELLCHVDYKPKKQKPGQWGPQQFSYIEKETCTRSGTKYMMPLYMLLCGYSEKGGYNCTLNEFRSRLQIGEKYKGFDAVSKLLQGLQKEMEIVGAKWSFNYTPVKTGKKTVTGLQFKIFANKTAYNANDSWLKLVRALEGDKMPYFAMLTEDQRETFYYLLNSKYDLNEVYQKLDKVHDALEKLKQSGQKLNNQRVFSYINTSFNEKFPPPG